MNEYILNISIFHFFFDNNLVTLAMRSLSLHTVAMHSWFFLLNTTCKTQYWVEKVCEPLDLITWSLSFRSNNLNQMFPVVAHRTCPMVGRKIGSFLFTKRFQFSNIIRMAGANHSLEVVPQPEMPSVPVWTYFVPAFPIC